MNKKKMGKNNKLLDQELLKYHLKYNPKTGIFTWKVPRAYWQKVNSVAGNIDISEKAGSYISIKIYGVKYKAHRLAWLYMTGEWPSHEIDHKDTDGLNNKWKNLRKCNYSQNACNRKISTRNTSGVKGVQIRGSKFRVAVQVNKNRHNIGTFETLEAAKLAYARASKKLHKEYSLLS